MRCRSSGLVQIADHLTEDVAWMHWAKQFQTRTFRICEVAGEREHALEEPFLAGGMEQSEHENHWQHPEPEMGNEPPSAQEMSAAAFRSRHGHQADPGSDWEAEQPGHPDPADEPMHAMHGLAEGEPELVHGGFGEGFAEGLQGHEGGAGEDGHGMAKIPASAQDLDALAQQELQEHGLNEPNEGFPDGRGQPVEEPAEAQNLLGHEGDHAGQDFPAEPPQEGAAHGGHEGDNAADLPVGSDAGGQ